MGRVKRINSQLRKGSELDAGGGGGRADAAGCSPLSRPPFLLTASGQCYTVGSNQHGQLGPTSCHASRVPYRVEGLQTIKVAMVGCGDAFTVVVGAGEPGDWDWERDGEPC